MILIDLWLEDPIPINPQNSVLQLSLSLNSQCTRISPIRTEKVDNNKSFDDAFKNSNIQVTSGSLWSYRERKCMQLQ